MAARTQTAVRTAQVRTAQRQKRELSKTSSPPAGHARSQRRRRSPRAARPPLHGIRAHEGESYFLAGGDSEDLVQEGLIGLCKVVRDFRPDKEMPFRSFAELCVTRQIMTVIKTATRIKHRALNSYASFSHTPPARIPTRTGRWRRAARLATSTSRRCR